MKYILTFLLLLCAAFTSAQSLAELTGEQVSLQDALAKVKGIDPTTYTTAQFRKDAAAYAESIGMRYWYSPSNGWNNLAILHAQPTNKVDSVRKAAPIFFPADKDGGKVGIMGNGSYVVYKPKPSHDALDLGWNGNVDNPSFLEDLPQQVKDSLFHAEVEAIRKQVDSLAHAADSIRAHNKRIVDSLRLLDAQGSLDWHMDRAEFNCNCEIDNGLDALNTRWMDLRTLARSLGKKHPLYATVNDCVQESKRAAHQAWSMENWEKRGGRIAIPKEHPQPDARPFDPVFGTTTVAVAYKQAPVKAVQAVKRKGKPSFGGVAGRGKKSGQRNRNIFRKATACKKASKGGKA